ncbi:MAG TPA: 4-alpha-glucanotransferase, partial [Verrucomicrobiae bacterium]|nr:4-alpha-glucanotransferase [Verrucomicrobiae bacterium]
MRLTFQLRFRTHVGQSLLLSGSHKIFGDGQVERAIPLQYLNGEFWLVTLTLGKRTTPDADITYHYILQNADGSLVHDWGDGRTINPASFGQEEVLVIDSWNHAGFYENTFYTEPFKNVLLQTHRTDVSVLSPTTATHTFRVKAPLLAQGQTLCLLGNIATLGNWNTAAPIFLSRVTGKDFLSTSLDLSRESFPLAYKYGVYDIERRAFIRYEDGENRTLQDTGVPGKHTVVNDGFVRLPANTWKGAGVAIPVFSLRSENSFGVGEFADLKLLADWGNQAGLKLIQILPVNDSIATHTWADSYPYAAISAFALHPLYLNLSQIATGPNKRLLQKLEPKRKRLNALKAVDYLAVVKTKLEFLRRIYPSQKQQTFKSRDYQDFFAANQHWLESYAVFCYLRDQYGTTDSSQWPAYRSCRPKEIAKLTDKKSKVYDEIAFHYFIQYHLHRQLHEASDYIHAKGLVLKGDIPIGVSRFSAGTWQQPELYHMDLQAGAPPDAFGIRGQNWSFPTYNWPRMKEDGFSWWKRRFEQMSRYFDAFRIDHILGFFRIWSIPMHAVEGILGYFVPAIPLEVHEFENRGIWFDRDRYLRPYITEPLLVDLFGKDCEKVKRDFLQTDRYGNYSLKPDFGTQRQVEGHFAKLKPNARNERIKQGLYDLISNVILFEVEGSQGRQYHFRFAIENTSSFKNLPPQTQAQLRE